jgi:pilus assembly protein Flp/PilA
MTKFLHMLWKDEEGATAIEYGLLAALIAVAIITTVGLLGDTLDRTFSKVNTDLTAEVPVATP